MNILYEDDVGKVSMDYHPDVGYIIHADIAKWGLSSYLHSSHVFDVIMENLHRKGIDKVAAAIPSVDTKNKKFAEMYGFINTHNTIVSNEHPEVEFELWEFVYTPQEIH